MRSWFSPYSGVPYVKRNFIANTFDGAIYSLAFSLVATNTVMPLFVKKISGSNILVGLLPVIWTLGFNFPQVIIANYVRRLPFKKPLLVITALGQRIPYLLLALLCWLFIGKTDPAVQIVLFFVCFAVAAVSGSLNLPGWFDLIAKLTPVKLRGRLFASRALLGGLFGIIGGWGVNYSLSRFEYPYSFAVLFIAAFLIMMCSYNFLLSIKEVEPNPQKDKIPYSEFFRRIPQLVKTQHNYRNYLIADICLTIALMADAFYALNAIEKFSLSDATVGTFTIISMISIIVGNVLFGYIADKFGHKLNLWMAATSYFIASMLAVIASSPAVYYVVFVFTAFTSTLIALSRLTIIAELCSEEDRPTYVSVTNMITSPFILLGIGGGLIANYFGYNFVFILAGCTALFSSFWYLKKVKEPRTLAPVVIS